MGHVWVSAFFEGTKAKKIVKTFVDTGSTHVMLPHKLVDELGAMRTGLWESAELANGKMEKFEVAIISLEVLGRKTVAKAYITKTEEPSLGALALEDLGLEVDPISGEVRPSRSWKARA